MAKVIPINRLINKKSVISSKKETARIQCESVIFPCTVRLATLEERRIYGIKGGK